MDYSVFTPMVFGAFAVASIALAVYGLHLYVLLFLFRRRSMMQREHQRRTIDRFIRERADDSWPVVTSQIPLYNEAEVTERVIAAVAAMDYPAGRHQIQIIDDSTDHTRRIVDRTVARLAAEGVNIQAVRREKRTDYKGGALANALRSCHGEFVAVFDADFVPPGNFLRRAVPLLASSPDLACVQGRWDHLNADESWLTRAQALGIDGHFAIEQGARAWNNLLMNFNGTAGIWRKAAIEDPAVGGWTGDTLTEDLDLSYRAQLAGWRIDYCLDLPCPAELPGHINALKSQQRRWATGSIQVACKLLPRIWRADLSLGQKVEATLHLTHYSVAVWMLILAVVARPMLFIWLDGRYLSDWFWLGWALILGAALAPSAVYTYARYSLGQGFSGLRTVPSMLILGMGMCVNNTIAVLRGLVLRGGTFERTPKSGSAAQRSVSSTYRPIQTHMWIIEFLLGIYSLTCFAYYVASDRPAFSIFLLLYGVGFLCVGWISRPERTVQSGPAPEPARVEVGVALAAAESTVEAVRG